MAKLKKVEFKEFGPYRIIGKKIRTKHEVYNPMFESKYPTIPSLWEKCFSEDIFKELLEMKEYCPKETENGYEGYMCNFNEKDQTFDYLVGFFMKAYTPIPEGYDFFEVNKCTILRAWVEGEEYDIYSSAYNLILEYIEQSNYSIDWNNYFFCEVYTENRFCVPKNNKQKILILDYYVPCLKQ